MATINGLKNRPDLVIVTGDLTHDADSTDEHAKRFKLFKEISGRIGGAQIKLVPGENDAALDGGDLRTSAAPPVCAPAASPSPGGAQQHHRLRDRAGGR